MLQAAGGCMRVLISRSASFTRLYLTQWKRRVTVPPSALRAMAPQKAIVRTSPDHPNVTVTLTVLGKVKNLTRDKGEEVSKALRRLQLSAAPAPDKKNKKKQPKGKPGAGSSPSKPPAAGAAGVAPASTAAAGGTPSTASSAAPSTAASGAEGPLEGPVEPFVGLYYGPAKDDAQLVSLETSNGSAWLAARLLVLGEQQYEVEVNPPTCDKLEIAGQLLAGYPICPVPTVRFAVEDSCQWCWFKEEGKGSWEALGHTDKVYTPGPADVGKRLRVHCVPCAPRPAGQEDRGPWLGEAATLEIGPIAASIPAAGLHRQGGSGRSPAHCPGWTEGDVLQPAGGSVL